MLLFRMLISLPQFEAAYIGKWPVAVYRKEFLLSPALLLNYSIKAPSKFGGIIISAMNANSKAANKSF